MSARFIIRIQDDFPACERPKVAVKGANLPLNGEIYPALRIAASILRRLRTMPASAISASTFSEPYRANHIRLEAAKSPAERLPLFQDRQPAWS